MSIEDMSTLEKLMVVLAGYWKIALNFWPVSLLLIGGSVALYIHERRTNE